MERDGGASVGGGGGRLGKNSDECVAKACWKLGGNLREGMKIIPAEYRRARETFGFCKVRTSTPILPLSFVCACCVSPLD